MTQEPVKRIEVIPDPDRNFVTLRIHRIILVAILAIFSVMTFTMIFTSVTGIKSDDQAARELVELRRDLDSTKEIIDNANDISRGSIEFQRCAFLIKPDVQKTPAVLDTCIKRANLPDE